MSQKTHRILFYVLMAAAGLSVLQNSVEMLNGPRHYDASLADGPGYQLILVLNAAGVGATALGFLGVAIFLLRKGGAQAPGLRKLGYGPTVFLILITILGYGVTSLFWIGGAMPNTIAALKGPLLLLMVALLMLMSWHTKRGVFDTESAADERGSHS